ncbi:hypothetical protein Tco_0491283 [Tanacetum coccineum]
MGHGRGLRNVFLSLAPAYKLEIVGKASPCSPFPIGNAISSAIGEMWCEAEILVEKFEYLEERVGCQEVKMFECDEGEKHARVRVWDGAPLGLLALHPEEQSWYQTKGQSYLKNLDCLL